MSFDDVLIQLGEFGRYQRRVYLLLCLPAISCALHKLSGVFLQARIEHRCRLPGEPANASFALPEAEWNASVPWDARADRWSRCLRLEAGRPRPCDDGWVFAPGRTSAVTEWGLVCERDWLRPTADAAVMAGVLLGALLFGALSDRFGRRPVFFASLVLQAAAGLLAALSPNYPVFLALRMVSGATTSGVFLVAYVLAMEMVGPRRRLVAGLGCQVFFSAGFMLIAVLAYLVPDWRLLQLALTAPGLGFLLYWWFVPESARWLLTRGRAAEARALLQRAAKENGVRLCPDQLDRLLPAPTPTPTPAGGKDAAPPQPSLFDLLRYPNMRRRSLNIFFNWFANNLTYYGLTWSTSELGGNDYINFLIAGAVEVPAYTFLLLTLNRWGRKTILCGCMLLGGAALLATLAVPAEERWLLVTLVMVGKLAITASYGTMYIFTAEQFPTVIRNVALGASSMCARVGGVLAPYANLLANVWPGLPRLLFGLLTLLAGLLALLLPETLHRKLPDTIAEGESFGRKLPHDSDPPPAKLPRS